MELKIREMKEDDLDQISKLEKICFSMPWSREMLKNELDNPLANYLVAVDDDDEVVGYVGIQSIPPEGDITNVAVAPYMRRKGIAFQLLERLISEEQKKGTNTFFLEVRESNAPAIALYTGIGFETIGVRKKYYSNPQEDALIMRKELSVDDYNGD